MTAAGNGLPSIGEEVIIEGKVLLRAGAAGEAERRDDDGKSALV
jgi:hypothetical protein